MRKCDLPVSDQLFVQFGPKFVSFSNTHARTHARTRTCTRTHTFVKYYQDLNIIRKQNCVRIAQVHLARHHK